MSQPGFTRSDLARVWKLRDRMFRQFTEPPAKDWYEQQRRVMRSWREWEEDQEAKIQSELRANLW